ncbi:MAG: DUF4040 family protein [Micrococcus sp.]|nr:DUF4040 family protein [Micrococcus sp.]
MLLISLLLAVLAVLVSPVAARVLGRDAGWVLALPLLASALVLALGGGLGVSDTQQAGAITESYPWIPSLSIELTLRLHGLSLVFSLLVLLIGAIILAYSSRYLGTDRATYRPGSFYLLMTTFAASMLLLVLTDDLVVFFVAWEFTTLASFFLIGRSGDHAREPAIRTLLVTVAGGLALLTAVCIMMVEAGTTRISAVLESTFWQDSSAGTLVAVLLAVAAFTKSAQFPFQAWLPDSMVAISPVSAYLHAAAMVKAGIFLLLLFSPALGGTLVWSTLLISCGLITAIFGAMTAMRQYDLKGLLAYSTMSQLGLLVATIGMGTPEALTAGIVHTVTHALFKCALFMLIGIVDKQAGTRDLRELAARTVRMPVTGTLIALAAISMAGVPPMLGFISKEGLIEAGLHAHGPAWLPWVVVAGFAWASVFTFAYSGRLVLGALGRWGDAPIGHAQPWIAGRGERVTEGSPAFWAAPGLAVLTTLVFSAAPFLLDGLISSAASDAAGHSVSAHLKLWHGLNLALAVSVGIMVLGTLLVLQRQRLENLAQRISSPVSGLDVVDRTRAGIIGVGAWTGSITGGAAPRAHLLIPSGLLGVFALVGVFTIGELPEVVGNRSPWHDWFLVALVAAGVIATLRVQTRIGAIVVVGVVGFAATLWFFNLGAVDVALTQLLVEVLTVCVMVLLLRRLPARFGKDTAPYRGLSFAVAAIAGVSAMLAVLAFTGRREMSEPAEYFLRETYDVTGAGNIVNSILVDFRALDTLGELTVLGVAGLSVAALLLNRRPDRLRRTWIDRHSPLASARENLVYARVFGRVVGPIIIAVSLVLLVRGHYEPGGGFNSALVAGAGYALMYLASESDDAKRLRWPYLALIGAGVVTGTATGLVGYATGDGFLTPIFFEIFGFTTSTALVFDIGVYLAVLGVVIAAFNLLGTPQKDDSAAEAVPAENARIPEEANG